MIVSATPMNVGGESIFIAGQYYNMQRQSDYDNATGVLKTYLDARLLEMRADAAVARRQELEKRRWMAGPAGAATVSVMQLRIAAFRQGRLSGMDTFMAALADSEFKVRWQCFDHFTRADLSVLTPTPLTAAQVDALFAAALAV